MNIKYEDQYVEALCSAMHRGAVRSYVLRRLYDSLARIGIVAECATDVLKLLSSLADRSDDNASLAEKVSAFQRLWRNHLDRAYLSGYEKVRWDFIKEFVLEFIEGQAGLGRCLDVGCGRGCITARLAKEATTTEIIGIDAADFSSEWRERLAAAEKGVRFEKVPVGAMDSWLQAAGQFDTVLMFYVLHHSDEHWAARALRDLRPSLRQQGKIIILEDTLISDLSPISDPFNLIPLWKDWVSAEGLFTLTAAFDVQVALDFVAVQLLAGFHDVRMPCQYRLGESWREFFSSVGYRVVQSRNIGFPANRDIDVPQGLFVLQLDPDS